MVEARAGRVSVAGDGGGSGEDEAEGAEAEEKERRAAGRRRDRRDMSDGWRPWERAGRGDGAPDRGG